MMSKLLLIVFAASSLVWFGCTNQGPDRNPASVLDAGIIEPMITASFAKISKGSFRMGSPLSEFNRESDESQRSVTITKDFEIMTTEVSQMQWFLVMGNNPSYFKSSLNCDNHITINGEGLCPSNPVESVSWKNVKEFIRKLNASVDSNVYRLPTEAEWEYAARGGTTSAYSWGNSSSSVKNYAWYDGNSGNRTHPVALKKANPYGLYDIHGNVWEWVEDWYTESPSGKNDPRGPSSGSYRVIRGGSWDYSVQNLRSAYRANGYPSDSFSFVGFRLVRTL